MAILFFRIFFRAYPSLLVVGPLVKELFFAAHLTKEGVSWEELLQHHLMKALDLRLKMVTITGTVLYAQKISRQPIPKSS